MVSSLLMGGDAGNGEKGWRGWVDGEYICETMAVSQSNQKERKQERNELGCIL